MSDYIENTYFLGKDELAKGEEGSFYQINRSTELDTIVQKISDDTLKDNCAVYLPKEEEGTKARMSDLINAIGLVFTLFRRANNQPVFMIMRKWDWKTVNGYYFFIGPHGSVKDKLLKLAEEEAKNSRWH